MIRGAETNIWRVVLGGFDSYPVYASGSHQAAVIGATLIGAVASLALGTAFPRPDVVDGSPGKGSGAGPEAVVPATVPVPEQHEPPSHLALPEPPPQVPAEPAQPHPPAGPVTPTVVAVKPSLTTTASPAPAAEPASRTPDRLQTASLAIGLVIGLITIAKELIAAFLALIH